MQHLKIFSLLVAVTCLGMGEARSQAIGDKYPWSASVSVGPAVPVGKFASSNYNDGHASFAKVGADRVLELNYQFSCYFAFTILGGLQNNSSAPPGLNATVTTSRLFEPNYNTKRIMAGPDFNYPFGKGKKWTMTSRLLGGVEKIPGGGYAISSGSSQEILYNYTFKTEFAYQAGAGLQYRFSRLWYTLAGADYVASAYKPVFTNTANTGSTTIPTSYRAPIQSLNVRLGIGARF